MVSKKSYNKTDKGELTTICTCRKGAKGGNVYVGSTACELCAHNYGHFTEKKAVLCGGY